MRTQSDSRVFGHTKVSKVLNREAISPRGAAFLTVVIAQWCSQAESERMLGLLDLYGFEAPREHCR